MPEQPDSRLKRFVRHSHSRLMLMSAFIPSAVRGRSSSHTFLVPSYRRESSNSFQISAEPHC
jgi:hypothetical protein